MCNTTMPEESGVKNSPQLVCVGEALVQLTPPRGSCLEAATHLEVHTAGAEMNVAVAVARMGHSCAFVSRLGDDPFGLRVLGKLQESGVDTSYVRRDTQRPTGIYFKDYDGDRTNMHYYRSGSAASAMSPADIGPWADRPAWFHLSGVFAGLGSSCLSLVDHLLDRIGQAGGKFSFDVNFRSGLWSVDDAAEPLLRIARRADLVFTGLDEATALWGAEDVTSIRDLLPSVPNLVVKDGAVGATSVGVEGQRFVPSLRAHVTEPVGAGDAFAAGFLSATIRGQRTRTAMRWGHLLATKALASVADQVQPPPGELLSHAAQMTEEEWTATAPPSW